jgi:hypothetical protein
MMTRARFSNSIAGIQKILSKTEQKKRISKLFIGTTRRENSEKYKNI